MRADGLIELESKCMEVADGSTANGTPIQVAECVNDPRQKWAGQPNGTIMNPASGKCLEVTNGRNETARRCSSMTATARSRRSGSSSSSST